MGNTKKVTSKAQWRKANESHELEVPSGNVALVRRPGMQAFLAEGIIPNSLLPLVEEAMKSGQAPDLSGIELTVERIQEMMRLYDSVALFCVVQPELTEVPPDGEPRDEANLYVDDIELDDKIFIFQWAVGGTSDLAKFREEQDAALASVRSGAGVESKAKRAPRSK